MGTFLVSLIIVAIVILAVRSLIKDKKRGGCSGCNGCSGHAADNASCGHEKENR